MPAELSLAVPARPDAGAGAVTYIAPIVEEKTRTSRCASRSHNGDGALKPEMFADVVLQAALGRGLVVPESAVPRHRPAARSSSSTTATAASSRARCRLGAKIGEGVQVLSGLAEGERVVTAANFLLDSESSLKAALAGLAARPRPPAIA